MYGARGARLPAAAAERHNSFLKTQPQTDRCEGHTRLPVLRASCVLRRCRVGARCSRARCGGVCGGRACCAALRARGARHNSRNPWQGCCCVARHGASARGRSFRAAPRGRGACCWVHGRGDAPPVRAPRRRVGWLRGGLPVAQLPLGAAARWLPGTRTRCAPCALQLRCGALTPALNCSPRSLWLRDCTLNAKSVLARLDGCVLTCAPRTARLRVARGG